MASYIPPHKRNGQSTTISNSKEEDKTLEPSNFPTLSTIRQSSKQVPWTATKLNFTEKPKQIPMYRQSESHSVIVRPFISARQNRYNENDYEEYPEDDFTGPTGPADDGWTTVTRKVRHKKTLIEKHEEELREEEEKKENEEKKDSVWNDELQEYQTYWDERRY